MFIASKGLARLMSIGRDLTFNLIDVCFPILFEYVVEGFIFIYPKSPQYKTIAFFIISWVNGWKFPDIPESSLRSSHKRKHGPTNAVEGRHPYASINKIFKLASYNKLVGSLVWQNK